MDKFHDCPVPYSMTLLQLNEGAEGNKYMRFEIKHEGVLWYKDVDLTYPEDGNKNGVGFIYMGQEASAEMESKYQIYLASKQRAEDQS